MEEIRKLANEKILVLDGGMGTVIQDHKLQEKDFRNDKLQEHELPLMGNNDVLSITRPEIIKSIHKSYFEAGADIVETNTFCSTTVAQKDYQLEEWVYNLNLQSARIAKEVANDFNELNPEKSRFVAGSIGPTNKTTSISPDINDPGYRSITFEELRQAYKLQIEGLVDGGVDLLLVETIFDTLNAKAALFAIKEVSKEKNKDLPIMISGTITDASGRTLSGQTVEAFYVSLVHVNPLSIGLNCALGAEQLMPYLKTLAKESRFFVSAHPNAGIPNEFGAYDQTPKEMVSYIEEYLKEGLVNIIGGCCGTTPDHISEISKIVKRYKPRKVAQ